METYGNLKIVISNEVDAKNFQKVFMASPFNFRKEATEKPYSYLYLPSPGTGTMTLVLNVLSKADCTTITEYLNEAFRQATESCDLKASVQGTAVILDDEGTVAALVFGCGTNFSIVPLHEVICKNVNYEQVSDAANEFLREQIWRYQPLFVKCPKCGEVFIPDATMDTDGSSKVVVPTGINTKENQLELLWTQAEIEANFVYFCPKCKEIVARTTEELKQLRPKEEDI